MKNIKTIDQFLLEALRDKWKKTIQFPSPKNKKYFSKYWGDDVYENILKDLLKFFTKIEPDWWEEYRENFEDEYYDEDEYRSENSFWRNPETKMMWKDYLDDIFREKLSGLCDFLDDNWIDGLVIYRNITVNQIWLDLFLNRENEEVHLGKYWAYDKNLAEAHWGDKDINVQFEVMCEMMDIDLWESFVSAIQNVDEGEITLFPNTPLELLSITIDGQEVDLSNFKNKEIYA